MDEINNIYQLYIPTHDKTKRFVVSAIDKIRIAFRIATQGLKYRPELFVTYHKTLDLKHGTFEWADAPSSLMCELKLKCKFPFIAGAPEKESIISLDWIDQYTPDQLEGYLRHEYRKWLMDVLMTSRWEKVESDNDRQEDE